MKTIVNILLLFLSLPGFADSAWNMSANGHIYSSFFSENAVQDRMNAIGLGISADQDRIGLLAKYDFFKLSLDTEEIQDSVLMGSLRYSLDQARLYAAKLDLYSIYESGGETYIQRGRGNKIVVVTNQLKQTAHIIYPQLSYLNANKTLYLDIGYAFSRYQVKNAQSSYIYQLSPSLGFSLTQRDWLHLRSFFIRSDDLLLEESESLHLRWLHTLNSNALLNQVYFSFQWGDRAFAIEPDDKVVYNMGEVQRRGINLGLISRLNKTTNLILQSGREYNRSFENGTDFEQSYIYLSLDHKW